MTHYAVRVERGGGVPLNRRPAQLFLSLSSEYSAMLRPLLAVVGLGLAAMSLEAQLPTPLEPSSPPSQERLALAARLVEAMGLERNESNLFPATPAGAPTNTASMVGLREFHGKYVTPEKLKPIFVNGYARRFDEIELTALIAFYESPVVRRFQDQQSAVIAEAAAVISAIYKEHAEEFRRAMIPPAP